MLRQAIDTRVVPSELTANAHDQRIVGEALVDMFRLVGRDNACRIAGASRPRLMPPTSDHSAPMLNMSCLLVFAPAASTPLTDQFMSPAWPKDGVPWVPGSQSHPHPSGSLTAGNKANPHRTKGVDRVNSSPSRRRTAGTGRRTGGTAATANAALGLDESDLCARFACGVPGCGHRFSERRFLSLHLRMGHSDFDRDRMRAAREGTEGTCTTDGLSITAPVDVGGRVRLAGGHPSETNNSNKRMDSLNSKVVSL